MKIKITKRTSIKILTYLTIGLLFTTLTSTDTKIDSLEREIKTALHDTAKVKALLALSNELRFVKQLPDSAMIFSRKALEIAEKQNWQIGMVNSLNSIGNCYAGKGDFENAINYYQRALAICRKNYHHILSNDNMAEIWFNATTLTLYYGLLPSYYYTGNKNKIPDLYEHLIAKLEKAGLSEKVALLQMEYGCALLSEHWSEFKKAITILSKALSYWKETGNKNKIITANLRISIAYQKQDLYPLSLKYTFAALKAATEINDSMSIVSAYHTLGSNYSTMGDYKTALEYFLKKLRIIERWNDKTSIAGTLMSIGITYYVLKDFPKSLDYHLRCIRICEEINNWAWQTMELNNIAIIYLEQGEYEKAVNNLLKAIEIRHKYHDEDGKAWYMNAVSDVYVKWGKPQMALDYYFKALKIIERLNSTEYFIRNYYGTANAYLQLKQYSLALEYAQKGLEVAIQTNKLAKIKETHHLLSKIAAQSGNFRLALEHFKQYAAYKDSISNEDKQKDIGKLEAKHEFEMQEMERKRKEEEQARVEAEQKARRDNLQYSGILIFLVFLLIATSFSGQLALPIRLAEGVVFFTFLLFFEFMLVYLDPYVEQLTGGEPAYKLTINAGLAAIIFPLHQFFETKLKQRIFKAKKRKIEKDRRR